MDRAAIRAFAQRPWDELEELKREHWAGLEPGRRDAAVAAARALWNQVRARHPDWPGEEERMADLSHQIQLKALLDAAAHAFPSS